MASLAWAEAGPGDVFREYKWRPDGKWQRVTGPDATAEGAKEFLPNSVNTIRIDDLDGAIKVEAYIEMLLCHGGTVGKKIRVNANPWIPIPESSFIPGKAGQGPPNSEYQYMRYPCVRIPMKYLRQGNNTFEFTCSLGTSLGGWWPQWILYGVTFRVYYDSSKPHPTGMIIKPSGGSTIGESPVLVAKATGPHPIKQVDFIGFYEDFNWEGDGNYRQWHYRYLYNEIKSHIGTATNKPYEVIWNNSWIPTQDRPMKIMARIVDAAGMCYMTSAVENIRLVRDKTVRMYKPYDVPKSWSTRVDNTHKCKTDVNDDLSKAVAAKIIMVTWNGVAADEIGINDKKIITKVGKNHDLSYDEFGVPLNLIRSGTNTLYTHSSTTHHGIEVQWPGMVLMVKYNEPERGSNWNKLILDDWTYIKVDNKRGKWGDWDEPNWLKYFGLAMADVTGDGYKDIIVEVNGDSRLDVVVSEERYPGPDPDASLYWFEQPSDPKNQTWKKHIVVTEYSLNNLDVADMDRDGDFDVITCEYKGPKGKFRLQIFENDGKGNFTEHIADRGKESHLGAKVADMDNDGDLDIVSVAWDNYRYLHLWRNDNRKGNKK